MDLTAWHFVSAALEKLRSLLGGWLGFHVAYLFQVKAANLPAEAESLNKVVVDNKSGGSVVGGSVSPVGRWMIIVCAPCVSHLHHPCLIECRILEDFFFVLKIWMGWM